MPNLFKTTILTYIHLIALIIIATLSSTSKSQAQTTESTQAQQPPKLVLEQGAEGFNIAVSPDGKTIASVGDISFVLIDAATGEILDRKGNDDYGQDIHDIAFSSNGGLLVYAGCGRANPGDSGQCEEGKISILDAVTGNKLRDIKTESVINAFAISPDGSTIAAASYANISVFDVKSGFLLRSMIAPEDEKTMGALDDLVVFSPDGKTVFSRGCAGFDEIDPITKCEGEKDEESRKLCLSMMETPACKRYGVNAWDAKTGTLSGRFDFEQQGRSVEGEITSLAVSPGGKYLIAGSSFFPDDNTRAGELYVFDVKTRKLLHKINAPSDAVGAIVFPSDENTFISGGSDEIAMMTDESQSNESSIYVWNANKGQKIGAYKVDYPAIYDIAVGPKRRVFISGAKNGSLTMLDLSTKNESPIQTGSAIYFTDIAISPSGDKFAMIAPSYMELWNLHTGTRKLSGDTHGDLDMPRMFFRNDKELIYYSVRTYVNDIIRADAESGSVIKAIKTNGSFEAATIVRDKNVFIAGYEASWVKEASSSINFIDLETGEQIASVPLTEKYISSLDVSSDGKHLAAVCYSMGKLPSIDDLKEATDTSEFYPLRIMSKIKNSVTIRDAQTGIVTDNFSSGLAQHISAVYSPDEKLLALTGCAKPGSAMGGVCLSGGLEVWDVASKQIVGKGTTSVVDLEETAFSPDGNFIAVTGSRSVDMSGAIAVWATDNFEKPRWVLKKQLGRVTAIAFSANSRFLFSNNMNDANSFVGLWSLSDGKLLAKIVSLTDGNWFVIGEDGRFDCSGCEGNGKSGGQKYIRWQKNKTRVKDDALFKQYYTPGLLSGLIK